MLAGAPRVLARLWVARPASLARPAGASLVQLQQLRLKHGAGALRSRRIVNSNQGASSVLVRASADAAPDTPVAAEFGSLGLSRELLAALGERGIVQPTEIQVSCGG